MANVVTCRLFGANFALRARLERRLCGRAQFRPRERHALCKGGICERGRETALTCCASHSAFFLGDDSLVAESTISEVGQVSEFEGDRW